MNDHFTKQTEEFIQAAQDVRIPENVQAIAEDGLAKTREAYAKATAVAKDAGKAFEAVAEVAQRGAKALGEKVLTNAEVNTRAAFEAAEAVAHAKTLPEIAKVQSDFVQTQVATLSEQTREFVELSQKVAKETLDHWSTAATRTFEQIKSAS